MFLAWFEIVTIFQNETHKSNVQSYILTKSYLLKND
jgi:hypothetical protein